MSDAALDRVIARLDEVLDEARELEDRHRDALERVHPEQRASARNLLHYLALRRTDLRDLQAELGRRGLSRLGLCEPHVLPTIEAVRYALHRLRGDDATAPAPDFDEGPARLRAQTRALLGEAAGRSSSGIMVTLPAEAADDPAVVRGMLEAGMTCARINCSQGDAEQWSRMLEHLAAARAELGRPCRVFMDLCGPKLRIGGLAPGPRVLRVRPREDARGRIVRPARVALVAEGDPAAAPDAASRIPVPAPFLERIEAGCTVEVVDTRGARRPLRVDERGEGVAWALCRGRLYLEAGAELALLDPEGRRVATGAVGDLPAKEGRLTLRPGDTLWIHKEDRPGEPARRGPDGRIAAPAHVAALFPDALDDVRVGEPLLLDDGKVDTVIRETRPDGILVEVTRAKPGGTKLKGHKGFNLPESHVGLTGLTEQDARDLEFVARHADGVNVSFVNEAADVEDLCDRLDALGADELGVVLKIETRRGVRNLPGILLAALRRPAVGVMIARGDLAVEAGWLRLAEVQEEIMRISEAARVPVVWATQVLERLAKKGQPTRAEISDVAMAKRAECVMLNKGPYILEAIRTLDRILASMEPYQVKKAVMLHPLDLSEPEPDPPAALQARGPEEARPETGAAT